MEKKENNEELLAFLKRKGFVYQGSEIYGGLAGIWEFGHLGKLMKNNLENVWKNYFLSLGDEFYEIEGSIIMPKNVFVASGHLDNFDDPLAECFKCGNTERADKIIEEKLKIRVESATDKELLKILNDNKLYCSKCKSKFEKVSRFNMMFPINFGPKEGSTVYLRPETAQTPYLNFKTQYELLRKKMPLGLAVIGKAFRNEISPKHSLIRCREFEQAELQIFFNPREINNEQITDTNTFSEIKNEKLKIILKDERNKPEKEISASKLLDYGLPKYYVYHMVKVQEYILQILKIPKEKFRFYELNDQEKAFYNKNHFDMEYYSESLNDWVEIGGVHYRTDHDLGGHQKISQVNLSVLDEKTNEKYIPHVLELSFGHWRNFYFLIEEHLKFDKKRENNILMLPPKIAPLKAAIFPMIKQPEYEDYARGIFNELKKEWNITYDKSGSIGRRYARNDEIGTPFCITIDQDSIKNKDVTIRNRDSTKQIRVKSSELKEIFKKLINEEVEFEKAGKLI